MVDTYPDITLHYGPGDNGQPQQSRTQQESESGPRKSSRDKADYPGSAPEVKRKHSDTGIFPNDELHDKRLTTIGKY